MTAQTSRGSFLVRMLALLGGVGSMSRLVEVEAAESEPLPIPMRARSPFTQAFADRVEACCHQQGKPLEDLAQEVSEIIGHRIRPERLIPMCCKELLDQEPLLEDWVSLADFVAIQLDVPAGWLIFGEGTATHPAPEWWN